MVTLGSAIAFTKVVKTRDEVRRIAAELSAAERDRDASPDAKARRIELEKRYDQASREFELAIEVFSATRKNGNG